MKQSTISAALLLPLLAACAGGGTTAGLVPQAAPAVGSSGIAQHPSEAQSDATQRAQPQFVSSSADLLYVGNPGNNSITVYPHDAAGNTAPLRVIAGANTQLSNPGQLSEDAQGNLYVANGGLTKPAILVFAHGANGNVAPIRTLAGPLTGIHDAGAVTVDQTTGKIFVVDVQNEQGFANVSLLRFAPGATGNVAPFARSAPGLDMPVQIASDSTGQNIIEAHNPHEPEDNGKGFGVGSLAKQFANGAALNYLSNTSAFGADGIADDPTTKTYLASNAGIYRFVEGSSGSNLFGPNFTPGIVSVITSDTCGGPLALGYLRNIYVTHRLAGYGSGFCSSDAVYVYAHDASGAAAPLRILTGAATELDGPDGIYEGQ